MNIQEIKNSYNIEEVLQNHIVGGLKRQGSQWVGNCPFHDDHHASLKISESKNRFKCFVTSCGAGGDVFDFFTMQGKTHDEAANIITGGSIMPASAPRIPKPENKWINAIPNQDFLPNPLDLMHFRYEQKPSNYWAYHDKNGNTIGFTCRFDLLDGKKDVLPYSFKQQISPDGLPLGNAVWRWSELDKPRPLYNLHQIYSRPNDTVLLVEGEKTADAAAKYFPHLICVTWIGGSDNVKYTDFSPLENRNVICWPDNDLPGLFAMFGGWSLNDTTKEYKRIFGITDLVKANFQQVKNHQSLPKKWDVADANWSNDEANDYLKMNTSEIPIISEFSPNELPLPAPPLKIIAPPPPADDLEPEGITSPYFKPLGFENNDQNVYVFFVYRANVIVKLSASGISPANLLQLAPLNYWEGNYPKQSRSGGVKFEITTVADDLISKCLKLGIFNPNKIRGRGAWIDEGKPVLHCGDILIVDGVYTPFNKHKSKFIYESGHELGFSLVEPLKKSEAYELIKLLERLNWSRDVDARLLAGWIVIAPLCGALNWRSHLWLTGASGCGKSEVMKLFVKKLLGQMSVDALGSTTEAGIRQYLKADALPVVFDEAESEDKKGMERMQSFLELVRASSTSDGGKIFKGSAGGSASQFNIRSCFAFASIGANLTQRSDISRITVLELKKDNSENHKEKWQKTLELYFQHITDDFVLKFQSRCIKMLPTILANAKIFSNAAAIELENQRTGDQLGIILAGAYSLSSDSLISLEDAKKWMAEKDWTNEKLSDSTRDETKVVNKIMDAEVLVETVYGKLTRTVGELVIIARGDVVEISESNLISEKLAETTLRRLGIKLDGFFIIFSDNSDAISKILTNTSYSKNYHTILSRVDGAIKMDPTTFASGIKSRAVKINSSVIFDGFENPGITEAENNLHK